MLEILIKNRVSKSHKCLIASAEPLGGKSALTFLDSFICHRNAARQESRDDAQHQESHSPVVWVMARSAGTVF